MTDLLRVECVSKSYGVHRALHDVSLSVPEGSIYGLLGPNGAGKTTLIRLINQILQPDAGRILLRGRTLERADVSSIGYLPEERGLYKKMRVGDQAIFLARLKGMSRSEATTELKRWFKKFDIEAWWGKRVEELSKGMAQKVQFIVTVLHRPPLLIFDEPFSGFDPINADLLKREILELRREGATILFSTHNMDSVQELCDYITLINRSENILSGAVSEVRSRYSSPSYRVGYAGGRVALDTLLPREWSLGREWDEDGLHWFSINVGDAPSVTMRALFAMLPETLDVVHLSREEASMHDIFVRAVSASSAETSNR